MLDELVRLVETREFNRAILEIEIRKLGHGCPFDPVAKCNFAPGVSCAEVDCPVWLDMVRNESC